MPESTSKIVVLIVLVLWLIIAVRLIVKALKNKYAPVKSVKAILTDKNKISTFSKYAGNGKQEKYVVIFSANGKKLSFYVSEFSYRGYKINESGTLTYKGNRIISFNG